ncbi:hypothetical protein GCM10009117_06540 [Gangjinia marincola]|uniref:DUF559 domain-containing protein n=1 Tax=Gangjinia marincola TaxID=578463 RepID=A0ABN1MEI3_9FLAO
MPNKIIPYKPSLREFARSLRQNCTLSEVLLWEKLKKKSLGVQFHRQVPMLDYVVDFYCHEIGLAIEVDGRIHEYKYFYDARRQGRLESEGVTFLRFSNDYVKYHLSTVINEIAEKVDELKL